MFDSGRSQQPQRISGESVDNAWTTHRQRTGKRSHRSDSPGRPTQPIERALRLTGMTITEHCSDQLIDASSPAPDDRRRVARVAVMAIAAVAILVVVLALLLGGGSSRSGDVATNSTVAAPARGAVKSLPAASGAASGAVDGAVDGAKPAVPAVPADSVTKVVKTGDMDLRVAKGKVPATIDQLIAIATLERGFVADSHSSEGVDATGSVTLRVPVESFDGAVSGVRHLHDATVVSQQTAGEDVSSKYVDLQARVHSLVATRTTYERLLAQATTIADTITVQSRITDVQTQIEQLQGELRVLNDQTTYGTLTVTVSESGAKVAPAHHRSGMSAAFHRSLDRFVNGIESIVGILGPLLLVLLLGALAVAVGRLVYRRVRRQLV
jgi:hypothetical protein